MKNNVEKIIEEFGNKDRELSAKLSLLDQATEEAEK